MWIYSVSMQYMRVDGAMYLRFRHIWTCGRTQTLNPTRVSLSNNAEVVSHIYNVLALFVFSG